jgi:hypothetical protein
MMQEPQIQGVQRYVGKTLMSSDGEKIGTIDEFINNRLTDVPTWIGVEAGFLGARRYIVPLAGSSFEDDAVLVPYTMAVISKEPEIGDGDDLTPEAESILSSYFGLGASDSNQAPSL